MALISFSDLAYSDVLLGSLAGFQSSSGPCRLFGGKQEIVTSQRQFAGVSALVPSIDYVVQPLM
jgi:hypothetical protein